MKVCPDDHVLMRIFVSDRDEFPLEREHLASCLSCAGRYRALGREVESIAQTVALIPPGRPARRWVSPPLLAGMAAVAAGALAIAFLLGRGSAPPTQMAANQSGISAAYDGAQLSAVMTLPDAEDAADPASDVVDSEAGGMAMAPSNDDVLLCVPGEGETYCSSPSGEDYSTQNYYSAQEALN